LGKGHEGHLIRNIPSTDLPWVLTAYLVDRQARGLSPQTIDYYSDELRKLQTYLEGRGIQHTEDVSADALRQYLLDLGARRSSGGVHCFYRAVRAFLRWAWMEYELAPPRPIAKVAAPRLSMQPLEPVSLDDVRAMLATCRGHSFTDDRDRAMLLALLDTGARAAEFLAIDLADVNLTTGTVIIRHGKADKWRATFLGSKAFRELLRYLRHRTDMPGPLWVTVNGTRPEYDGLRRVMCRRARMANVQTPNIHSFRRAFCLGMLRGGADIVSLSRLMGHANLSLIMTYAKQAHEDLLAAHQRAGPVDNLL
jgi:integrase/recombinase XerD